MEKSVRVANMPPLNPEHTKTLNESRGHTPRRLNGTQGQAVPWSGGDRGRDSLVYPGPHIHGVTTEEDKEG